MSLTERILGLAGLIAQRNPGLPHLPEVVEWLHRYGYLPELDCEDRIGAGKRFLAALSRAHDFHGLDKGSTVDCIHGLLGFIKRPRCGHPDPIPQAGSLITNAWKAAGISTIRIGFANYLPGWAASSQAELTMLAAQSWEKVCGVKFELARDGAACEILVQNAPARESDGPGGTLAWTFLPQDYFRGARPPLPLYIDTREPWAFNPDKGTPYRNMFAHELGHAIGLSHSSPSDNRRSLLDPYLDKGVATPQAEDIERIRAVWGPPAAAPAPTPKPTPSPERTVIRFDGGELHVAGPVRIDGYRITKVDAREGSVQ